MYYNFNMQNMTIILRIEIQEDITSEEFCKMIEESR